MKTLSLFSVFVVGTFARPGFSQGCSDAGFCSLRGLKDHAKEERSAESFRSTLAAGLSYGQGDRNVSVTTAYVELHRAVTEKLSLTGKATAVRASGELCDNAGFGDLFLNAEHTLAQSENGKSSLTAGWKLPLGHADAGNSGFDYPMGYQTTLGTHDLIAGASLVRGSFGLSVALQQPLIRANQNQFLPDSYPDPRAAQYLPTTDYQRKGDVLVRASYAWDLVKGKFSVRPSLLPIYHLGDDTYVDAAGQTQKIAGSKGLTLNGNLFLNFKFTESQAVEIALGAPFVARKARPDGLTRKFVAGVEYGISF